LNSLSAEHQIIEKYFSELYGWRWFASDAMRPNVLPWADQSIFKPYFFAKAAWDWIQENPNIEELLLVNTPADAAGYLLDFLQQDKDGLVTCIEGPVGLERRDSPRWFKGLGEFVFLFVRIIIRHGFRSSVLPKGKRLALCEALLGDPLSGIDYFFGRIFDFLSPEQRPQWVCLSIRDGAAKFSKSGVPPFFLLDVTGPSSVFTAIRQSFWLTTFSKKLDWLIEDRPELFGPPESRLWREFFRTKVKMKTVFLNILIFNALDKLLKKSQVQVVIHNFEDKPSEKMIFHACALNNIKSIGYVIHPMSECLFSLRDYDNPTKPKPSMLRICGSMVLDHLECWAKISRDRMRVWGTGKTINLEPVIPAHQNDPTIRVLFLVSHPDEILSFVKWVKIAPELRIRARYSFRRYAGALSSAFTRAETEAKRVLGALEITNGSIAEDFASTNIALFSATSAGFLAADHGVIAVHCDLCGFFPIEPNPVVRDMLHCAHPQDLIQRLDEIGSGSEEDHRRILRKQARVARGIFETPLESSISSDLFQID